MEFVFLEMFFMGELAANEEGAKGVYIPDSQKLVVAVQFMCLLELPTS